MNDWIQTALRELEAAYLAAVERHKETHAARFVAIEADDTARRQRDDFERLLSYFRDFAEAQTEGGAK